MNHFHDVKKKNTQLKAKKGIHMKKEKVIAIVLAAGKGKRMKSDTAKQYMMLGKYPVIYYSLKQFEQSGVDEIILVVGEGEVEYCSKEIVEKFQIKKVTNIIEGGKERYESVYHALATIKEGEYVLIHDGARPMITEEIIASSIENVKQYRACVVGVPVKDTIKFVDKDNYAKETPDRNFIWAVQTPQSFQLQIIKQAYENMMVSEDKSVTDDAMVVERYTKQSIKMIMGSYENIKITTPEDLAIAKCFLII